MIFLYSVLSLLLGVTRFLLSRRAATLERKYARAALAADKLLHEPAFKGGNSRQDQYQTAKKHYLLGQLVQKRDRLEAKYHAWEARAERFAKLTAAVRGWKGKKLPYTFGALDVYFLLALADQFGVGERVSARALVEYLSTLLAN